MEKDVWDELNWCLLPPFSRINLYDYPLNMIDGEGLVRAWSDED